MHKPFLAVVVQECRHVVQATYSSLVCDIVYAGVGVSNVRNEDRVVLQCKVTCTYNCDFEIVTSPQCSICSLIIELVTRLDGKGDSLQ